MGSQRYLIEDLDRRGVRDPAMGLVRAIEDLRAIGDTASEIVHGWLEGGSADDMLTGFEELHAVIELAQATIMHAARSLES